MWVSRPWLLFRIFGCSMPGLPEKWGQGSGDLEFGLNLIALWIQQERAEPSRKWMSAGPPGIGCTEWWLRSWDGPQHSSFLGMCLLLLTSKGRIYFSSPRIQSCLVMALIPRKLALETFTLAILWEAQAVWRCHGEENKNALVGAPDEPKADSQHQHHPYEWVILDILALSSRWW